MSLTDILLMLGLAARLIASAIAAQLAGEELLQVLQGLVGQSVVIIHCRGHRAAAGREGETLGIIRA